MMTVVVPRTGFYVVGTLTRQGLETEHVDKQKQCTCGGTGDSPCSHIRAVAAYLRLGGRQAPAPERDDPSPTVDLPDRCPICGSPVEPQAHRWRCTEAASHYWQWRGEEFGVKAFLTQPHPAKAGAFYEQSIEERDAFLEQIHHRLYARDYSPYR